MLPARLGDRVDHVVGVFLKRVVDTRLRCRVAAVIVHAKAAADIDVGNVDTESPQLRVVPRHLLQPGLDIANVRDLGPEVKVNQLEDVEPAFLLQPVDEPHQLRRAEAELRLLATTLCPASGAFGVELDAHPGSRRDAELVGDLEQDVHLAQLLEHNEDLMPELLTHQGEAHELLVLVAVAHDHVISVLGESEYGLKLRLAPALQADASDFSKLDYLFDHVALLIHLDRVNRRVSALIGKFSAGTREFLVQRFDSRSQDIRETQQQRQANALLLQIVR